MKTFFIIIAILFALRFIMPYVMKYLLKTFVQKQMRKAQQFAQQGRGQAPPFGRQAPPFQSQANRAPKGKVKVAYVPEEQRQRKDFPGGEYVEYEEVK
ncbi:DUF4834 family protein [Rufibacter sp. LB8]|uniref:DUF4834 family protein n=1 Tax=Rufibacter sp. LB8 TaxID=2777781 RepID=UPI001CEF830E|nr:DUF4834 family protein [Rufibacter sp. LB8]